MNWLTDLFIGNSVAHTILIYAIVIAIGVMLGNVKIFGISLGATFVLFCGILVGHLGVTMAVASNKYQKAVSKIIPHYYPDIDFIAIEGQKDGVNVKPDPSIVFSILAKAKVAKADALYIGDSGVDMETARRACIDAVGVTWGFRSKKELVEYHADAIVNNPIDILNIVENGIRIS